MEAYGHMRFDSIGYFKIIEFKRRWGVPHVLVEYSIGVDTPEQVWLCVDDAIKLSLNFNLDEVNWVATTYERS